MATLPRSKRFIGPTAALGAVVSITLFCDDTSSLAKDVEDILQTKIETSATMQRVQSSNGEDFFLLGNEVPLSQENAKNHRDAVQDHLQTFNEKFTLFQVELTLYKECTEKQTKHSLFAQEIRYVISQLGTLHTHIKSNQAAFYACTFNLFWPILSLNSGQVNPQFLLSQQNADIVRTLSKEESYSGTKFTPAIHPGFEIIYYEIQHVLEVKLILHVI